MAMVANDRGFSALAEVLSERGLDGLGHAVEILINEAMRIERDRHIHATPYERTEMRSGYANGFKPKQLNTRLGALNLQVPQEVYFKVCKQVFMCKKYTQITWV